MDVLLQLCVYVVSLEVTMLEAMFSQRSGRLRNSKSPFDVRLGDHVAVYIISNVSDTGNVLSGFLEGPLERAENPGRGPTDDRFFVRLPSGVVLYANLFPRPHLSGGFDGPDRFYIEGRDNTLSTGVLLSPKPSRPKSVWLTKNLPNHPGTPYMWADLESLIGSVPHWAQRNSINL